MKRLDVARELESMAQIGLHFSTDPYDRERYARLREIASELLAGSSTLSCQDVYEWSAAEFGYATPKVDVRAFIPQGDEVLLVREDADGGKWTLPGGWADVNETPSASVVREVEEESGYQVEARGLLAVLDRERQGHPPPFPYHVYKIFFHCERVGGSPRSTPESSESRFFAITDLPVLSESRVLPHQILAFHQAIQTGAPATAFD